MAVQDEIIELRYETSAAEKSADRVNRKIADGERAAEKVGEAMGRSMDGAVRVTDRSASAIERRLRSLERSATLAGKTGVEKLLAERDLATKGLADPKTLERINSLYGKMIAAETTRTQKLQQEAEAARKAAEAESQRERMLRAAQRAAQEAASREREFQQALRATQEAARKREQSVAGIESRAAVSGKSSVERLALERDQFIGANPKLSTEQVDRVRAAYGRLIEAQHRAANPPPMSLTEQIVQAGLLLAVTEKIISTMKEATVGSALYAARTEQLGVALGAVAKANAVSSGTIGVLEGKIKALGVTTQDARQNLARLVAANVDLTKAAQLARAAQDLGRVSGEGTAAAFERLTHAIVTAQPEMLRHLGLSVDLEKTYQRIASASGRTVQSLTEQEKMQIRVNTVLAAAQNYAGVYAQSLGTVTGRLLSLERKAAEARNAIGGQFQGEAGMTISVLEKLADLVGKYPGLFVAMGSAATIAAGGIAAAFGGPVLATLGTVVGTVVTLTVALQKAARLTGDVKYAYTLSTKSDQDYAKEAEQQLRMIAIEKQMESASKQASEAQRIHEAQAAKARELREEQIKRVADAEKRSAEILRQAKLSEYTGMAQIIAQHAEYRRELGLSGAANQNLAKAALLRIQAESRKELQRGATDRLREIQTDSDASQSFHQRQMRERTAREDESNRTVLEALRARFETEDQVLSRRRETELRALDATAKYTVDQKLAVEARKSEIEERYLKLSMERKARMLKLDQDIELMGVSDPERVNAIMQKYAAMGERINQEYEDNITTIHEDSAIRRAQIEHEAMQSGFDRTRDSFDSMLDVMLGTARSWGERLSALWRAAILQPLKESASTTLASIFGGGGRGTTAGGSRGGLFGGVGMPSFGGMMGPGGTPPFLPGRTAGAARGGYAGLGLAGMGSMFFNSGSIALGGGMATTAAGIGGFGGTMAGIASSPAALMGGGMLAMYGAQRGGLLGTAMTTGGGALAGFMLGSKIGSIGGPMGMLIGAGIGAAAGIISSLFKRGEQKMIEKVRQLYQVSIDKNFARQLVEMTKQQYGGNMDVAIRAPQVREMIQLWAMANGKSIGGFGPQYAPPSLYERGGQVWQDRGYYNGAAQPSMGGAIPAVAMPQAPQPTTTVIRLDGEATTNLLRGEAVEVVASSTRIVARSAAQGSAATGAGSLFTKQALAPGLI